jgi:hypothetical protein
VPPTIYVAKRGGVPTAASRGGVEPPTQDAAEQHIGKVDDDGDTNDYRSEQQHPSACLLNLMSCGFGQG